MMRKMNKRVYGVMLAAMMAASVSVTACGGQGKHWKTMTADRFQKNPWVCRIRLQTMPRWKRQRKCRFFH